VHPRFRTLTTGFLSEDLVSGPQRRVFFLGTSFQVRLEVWTRYWESRFRSFIEDSGHLGSGPWRFWGPRSFQDLVLFLSPQTDGQTPCLLLYIGLGEATRPNCLNLLCPILYINSLRPWRSSGFRPTGLSGNRRAEFPVPSLWAKLLEEIRLWHSSSERRPEIANVKNGVPSRVRSGLCVTELGNFCSKEHPLREVISSHFSESFWYGRCWFWVL